MGETGRGRPFEGAASEWRMVDGKGWDSCGLRGGAAAGVKGVAEEGTVAVGAGRRRRRDATGPGLRGVGGGGLGVDRRWVGGQGLARRGPFEGEVGPGVEAVMADADEAFGEDVEEEAAKEFVGVEGEGSFAGESVAVANGEGDGGRSERDEAVVGDADAMGVVAEVAKELGGAVEGAFGIDDPGFLVEGVSKRGPGVRVLQVGEGTRELKCAAFIRLDKALDKEMFKAFAEHLHGQEEVRAGVDPATAIGGKAAGRDDAVDVGVMGEVLRPGMEDGGEANVGAEMTRVGRDIEEGLGRSMEQEIVEALGIPKEERAEGIGKGEDDVEMGHGEDAGQGALDPLSPFTALAFGAVAIAAGIVGDILRMPARRAGIDVTPEARGAADTQPIKNLALPRGGSVLSEVVVSVLSDDIRDLEMRTPEAHVLRIPITAQMID